MSLISAFKRTFGFINNHALAKRHLLRSYARFFWWQLRSRMTKKAIVINYVNDTKYWAKKNMNGITGNIYAGLHEFEDMAFLLHFLRKNDVFFDIGANVGAYTILAAGVCKTKTISIEPIAETFINMEHNIKLNKLEGLVETVQKGIGKELTKMQFTNNKDSKNHVLLNEQPNSIIVDIIPLDTFAAYAPSLLKIDVEGFETEVINGAAQILNHSNLKAIIIELNGCGNKYGYSDLEIHQKLKALNFNPYQYQPYLRKLIPIDSYGKLNTLYVRDITFVNDRLKNANPFRIYNETI